jgi:hypothetical protein
MVTETGVRCEECGSHYAVRFLDGEFILPSEDGRCRYGNAFDEQGETVRSEKE